jgi:hypothetical protein
MLATLLPYQRDAVLSPHSHKAILATRRAGKSHAACVALIVAALSRDDAICYYLALTRQSAKRIAWKTLKNLCRKHKIKADFSESDLVATFANGGTISLYGVNQEGLLDNLRGTPVDLAVLDECASYRGGIVAELIEDVLEPAFADYDGRLILIGTPGPVCAGYFYDATTGELPEFERYKWDIRNNIHVARGDPLGWLDKHRRKKGWSLDNPKYRREYCGEWVSSGELNVYAFSRDKNIGPLPAYELTHTILAVDLGHVDDMAFVVIGYNPLRSKAVHVLYSKSESRMQLADAARTVQGLQARFAPHATVIDEGGLGKAIAEDWRTRLGIPCEAAKKQEKRAYIELLNSDLHEGLVVIPEEHSKLIGELINLMWDDDTRKAEDPKLPNHLCDALLYAWRKAYAYTHKEVTPPARKSDEQLVQEQFAREDARAIMQEQGEWWEHA